MIHIYKSNNTNYSNNGDMILNPSEATLTIELNGLNCIEVTQPYDSLRRFDEIKGDRVVKIDAPNNQVMFYRIGETNRDLETEVNFNALPLAEVDLQKSVLVDCRPTGATGQEFLNSVLKGTKYTGKSNITKVNTSHLIRKSRYEALFNDENSFLSRYGGEIWLEGFNIHINEQIGIDKNVTFEYGKDILDLNEKLLWNGVVTRVYPIGYDGITLPDTGYIDSTNINKYQEIREAFIKYEDVKVKQNAEDEGFNTLEEAQAELRRRALKEFENGIDLPQLEMNIEVAKLEEYLEYANFKDLIKVDLGDTVRVRHSLLDIDITTRVVAIKYDLINEKYTEITLSSQVDDYIKNLVDTNRKITTALNDDGSIKAGEIKGFIDATKARLKASKEVAQKQEYRVAEVEDLDPESPTYGSMVWGTGGMYISQQRNAQNTDWDYTTAITAEGLIADKIVGNLLASRNALTWISMIDGTFNFANKIKFDGKKCTFDFSGNDVATGSDLNDLKDDLNTNISNASKDLRSDYQNATTYIDNKGVLIKNGALQVSNKNGDTVIDGSKYLHYIEMYGNGAIVIQNGQVSALVTIPHNKGFTPDIKGEWLDITGKVYNDPYVEYDWSATNGYHGPTLVCRMSADNNNLYIHAQRVASRQNLGTDTLYYRYFILGGVKY